MSDGRIMELEQEMKNLRTEVKELRTLNKEVLELFHNNIKSIGLSERMKQKGPGNPRYKPEVETGMVIEDYIKNDYHITTEMTRKYGMSYQGLRLRLKAAGALNERKNENEKVSN